MGNDPKNQKYKHLHACLHYSELMKEQTKVMSRHLNRHKYFQHIKDINNAAADFVEKYGWIMRQVYCDLCSDNQDCKIYKKDLEGLSE